MAIYPNKCLQSRALSRFDGFENECFTFLSGISFTTCDACVFVYLYERGVLQMLLLLLLLLQ